MLRDWLERKLPEGYLIDCDGNPTTDPEDYFNGGAILPAGEHKGYGLGLLGEIVADAFAGRAKNRRKTGYSLC